MKRYEDKKILQNQEDSYSEILEDRGVKYIRQYGSANLTHPDATDIGTLERVGHIWQIGDRYYKLAHQYYGNSKYWWVIAWYNQKPTESHVALGDVLKIPFPLYKVLSFLRNE